MSPARSSTSAVPCVATSLKSSCTKNLAISATAALSRSLTLMKTVPAVGQCLSGGKLRLGEGLAEIIGHAHDFTGGFHLRAEHGVHPGKLVPGKYRRLHVVIVARAEVGAVLDVF